MRTQEGQTKSFPSKYGVFFVFAVCALALLPTGCGRKPSADFATDLTKASHLLADGKSAEAVRVADRALEKIRLAESNDKEVSRAEKVVGVFYTVAAQSVFNEGHRHQEVIDLCDRALQLAPDFPDAHYYKGLALQSLGRVGEAVASWESALRLDPEHPRARLNLAMHYYVKGDRPKSLQEIDRAIGAFEKKRVPKGDFFATLARRLKVEWTAVKK